MQRHSHHRRRKSSMNSETHILGTLMADTWSNCHAYLGFMEVLIPSTVEHSPKVEDRQPQLPGWTHSLSKRWQLRLPTLADCTHCCHPWQHRKSSWRHLSRENLEKSCSPSNSLHGISTWCLRQHSLNSTSGDTHQSGHTMWGMRRWFLHFRPGVCSGLHLNQQAPASSFPHAGKRQHHSSSTWPLNISLSPS